MKSIEQRLSLLEKRVGIVENKEIYKIGDLVQLSNGDIWKVVRYGMNRPEDNLKPNEIVMKPVKSPGSISLPIPWTYEYLEKMGAKVIKESRNYKLSQKESIQKVNGTRVRVYDNGGETLDRVTIVFLDFEKERNGEYQAVAASETGVGFYSHISCKLGKHLGKEIPFSSLNPRLQKMVKEIDLVNESKKIRYKRVNESKKRKLTESISVEDFRDLNEREQLEYFCKYAEDKFGFNISREGKKLICPIDANPRVDEKLNYLDDCIESFNSQYGTEYFTTNFRNSNSNWGEFYEILK